MRGQRATGKIQRNNLYHESCVPSLTGKTSSVSLIVTHGTHRNVKNRWVRSGLYLLFWRETYSQTFSAEFLSYLSKIPEEKTACHRPLKNQHFVGVCTDKMMDRRLRETSAINIYSNCNQMRPYVECSPNQSKKLYLIDLSIEQSPNL